MKLKIANYVLFQLGWFACVLGAAHGMPLAGPAVVAAIVAVHLSLARRPGVEAALLAACAVIGGLFDTLLLATGWVAYPNGQWIPGAAPYWIFAMWLLFAATLNLSLGWLKGRPLLAGALGAAGAPLSYVAGAGLGAITLVQPFWALAMLAGGWALLMPLLAGLAGRMNGFADAGNGMPAWILSSWRSSSTVPGPSYAVAARARRARSPEAGNRD